MYLLISFLTSIYMELTLFCFALSDLLEKARVISQQALERSYHIFYQMMSGSVKGVKEMCMLSNRIEEYYFISQGKTRIPGVNDGSEFELTDVSIVDRLISSLEIPLILLLSLEMPLILSIYP
ncbi:myosin heavy chain, muscle-like isoform X2 [Diaphorina citri]|uniref:Myosin heavy chain, muscle-like isoform X2 n=1 Tax=Diaphorina citri TaxID=121845 RepID=A0A3Q0JQX0_DIACI|nr:myosin heavy chain, muscle-like isoform X2 [Diaphorina citri]